MALLFPPFPAVPSVLRDGTFGTITTVSYVNTGAQSPNRRVTSPALSRREPWSCLAQSLLPVADTLAFSPIPTRLAEVTITGATSRKLPGLDYVSMIAYARTRVPTGEGIHQPFPGYGCAL